MRDPNRILIILEKIREHWARYPDLRLGQLIVNLTRFSDQTGIDLFNVEDDVLLEWLEKELEADDGKNN